MHIKHPILIYGFTTLSVMGAVVMLIGVPLWFIGSLFPTPMAPRGWKCEGAGCHLKFGTFLGIRIGSLKDDVFHAFCRARASKQIRYDFGSTAAIKGNCLAAFGQKMFSSDDISFTFGRAKGFWCLPTGRPNGELVFDKSTRRLESVGMWCHQAFI